MNRIKRTIYICIGLISLVIGTIGVFIPVLPTVPFLLLSVFCFGRSSQRLYDFMMNNRYFGETIRRYKAGEGVSVPTKIRAILFTSLGIGFSIYKVNSLPSRIFMAIVWVCVVIHIVMIKNYKAPERSVNVLSASENKEL